MYRLYIDVSLIRRQNSGEQVPSGEGVRNETFRKRFVPGERRREHSQAGNFGRNRNAQPLHLTHEGCPTLCVQGTGEEGLRQPSPIRYD